MSCAGKLMSSKSSAVTCRRKRVTSGQAYGALDWGLAIGSVSITAGLQQAMQVKEILCSWDKQYYLSCIGHHSIHGWQGKLACA